LLNLAGRLSARDVGEEVQQGPGQSNHEENAGQDAACDQREDARRRIPFAEVGQDVQRDDRADEADDEQIGLEVGRREEDSQDFAAGFDAGAAPSRMSISCEMRSSGTGNTITVFRSTPISVRVCR